MTAPRNHTLVKNYRAAAALAPYRIVKFGAADGEVALAAAATDAAIGTTDISANQSAAGTRVDVVRAGLAEVEYGGAVTRGQLLTADATGRAIAASGAGRVIGVAEVSGVEGDIGSVLIAPGATAA